MQEIKSYLAEHFRERVTLSDLERRFNVSKYHLQRLFTRYAGRSPGAYQTALRIKHAKELLRATDLPVSEVAYRVGIENTSYFIRLFKQQEAVTPQRYRRSWSGADLP